MRVIITGHREEKISNYFTPWIYNTLNNLIYTLHIDNGITLAYSGMASGVDLEFCKSCFMYHIPYIACVPFDEQEDYMTEEAKTERRVLLGAAKEIKKVKNSWMVEHAAAAIVVWDGNKGGTHNVLQQLIEKKIPFHWINPVSEKVWHCI